MILLLLLLILIGFVRTEDLRHEFSTFTSTLKYTSSAERSLRFVLYRKSVAFVAAQNSKGLSWRSEVNFFADLTEEERRQYLGLNVTMVMTPVTKVTTPVTKVMTLQGDPPETVNWVEKGYVTPVKNQGRCGSCWTFGAVGAIEAGYKGTRGKLKSFAEQELLECVDEARNGCAGGWPIKAFQYSQRRLATTLNYPYLAEDRGKCDMSTVPNGLKSARVMGHVSVRHGESDHISAIAINPTTALFQVTLAFHYYRDGVIKDTTCLGAPNHAVVVVGYAFRHYLVKNSWGRDWGDGGFVKFARWHDGCGLHKNVVYPTFAVVEGANDTDPETAPSDYDPDENPGPDPIPDPNCKDEMEGWCTEEVCEYRVYKEIFCKKTCDFCWMYPTVQPPPDVCPGGTVRCSDGTCKHEHMC